MLHVQVSTAQAACGIQADQAEAHSHWLAAAAVSGPHQSAAFAKLGLWYATVKTDLPRARKCFQRSLGLNPLHAEAGAQLESVYLVVSCSELHRVFAICCL